MGEKKHNYDWRILLLPFILLITALFLNYAKGPFWLAYNSDPDYAYLFNSLNAAELHRLYHIDHPGTPVQIMGASILRLLYFFRSTGNDFQSDVLKNPEIYLETINATLLIINVLSVLIIGMVAFRLTGKVWPGILLQLSPFFSIIILDYGFRRVSPEPLLTLSSFLIASIVLLMSLRNEDKIAFIIAFALVCGFGVAVKVTFLPLILVPLIGIPGFRKKIVFLFGACLSFVLFTLPVISQYKYFFNWISRLLFHTGRYGHGSTGFIKIKSFLQNIVKLIIDNQIFSIILLIAIIVSITSMLIYRKNNTSKKTLLLAGLVCAQLFGILFVAKHPYEERYLLPILNLSGITLVLVYMVLEEIAKSYDFIIKLRIFLIGFVLMANSVIISINIVSTYIADNNLKMSSIELNQYIKNQKYYINLCFYSSSSQAYALFFGNQWAGYLHSDSLKRIYGQKFFYNKWSGDLVSWSKIFLFKDLLNKYGNRIIFQGMPLKNYEKIIKTRTGLYIKLQDVLNRKDETVYKIESITREGLNNRKK